MEWVSGLEWNHCPLSRGMGVRIALEYSSLPGKVIQALTANQDAGKSN